MKDSVSTPVQSPVLADRYPLFSSIRGRLYLLLLSVLIPVMLVQAGYLYVRFRARVGNESQANLEMSQAVAGTFSEFIKDILHQELAIGTNLSMPYPLSAAEMNQVLETNRAEYSCVRNFSWVDPEGRVIASSIGSAVGLDVSDRAYFQEVLSGKEWVVGDISHGLRQPKDRNR